MPRERHTCTRCSMRRQKCDRAMPCKRCVAGGVAESCTRHWDDTYDAAVHRQYPKARSVLRSSNRQGRRSPSRNITDVSAIDVESPPNEDVGATEERSSGPSTPHFSARSTALTRDTIQSTDIAALQSLLPNVTCLFWLVDYHEEQLLWYHSSLCMPLFRKQLKHALQGGINLQSLDFRWSALFFAMLCSSIICTDETTALSWGYSRTQKYEAGKQWYNASMSCLHHGRFLSEAHINSIQTILVLSISAHLLGHSSELFTLFGVALRLAQKLGLHKLSYDERPDSIEHPFDLHSDMVLRETGRRVWTQLQTHDNFGVAVIDMSSIHPRHFRTALPRRIEDETMTSTADLTPLTIDWATWLLELSKIIAIFHDIMTNEENEETTYKHVLEFDLKIRGHTLPASLHSSDKQWTKWAKQEAAIAKANKIAFVHRKYFVKAFNDECYAYSRWASIEASRTVIREVGTAYLTARKRPRLWNDQAHVVGACITICLDLSQRDEDDAVVKEQHDCLEQGLAYLRTQEDSVLAKQGSTLISTLLRGGKLALGRSLAEVDKSAAIQYPLEARKDLDALRRVHADGVTSTSPQAEPLLPLPSANISDAHLGDLSWLGVASEAFQGLEDGISIEDLMRTWTN